MSGGGPPHHSHNRHVPPGNSAWNHLQVPSYFPRQPQVAHMQSEHSLLHQGSWHTPSTNDAMKLLPHQQMLNEMFKNEALFPRDCVDLSLTRNGNQNGEVPPTPSAISLSVRDTSKINSLAAGMLDVHAMELTKLASPNLKSGISPGPIRTPGMKSASPGMLGSVGGGMRSLSPGRKASSPGPKSATPCLNLPSSLQILPAMSASISGLDMGKNQKRSNIRVDSILERLNPTPDKTFPFQDLKQYDQPSSASSSVSITSVTSLLEKSQADKAPAAPSQSQSVIVSAATSYDENSNSSGTTNAPTPKEEDSASMHSNEDSLDSTKSRRKRKPSKTIRVNKEDDIKIEKDLYPMETPSIDHQNFPQHPQPIQLVNNHRSDPPTDISPHPPTVDPISIAKILEGGANGPKIPERLQPPLDEIDSGALPPKTRRKASSESETIDDIAAMVQEGLREKERRTGGVEGGGEEMDRKVEETVVKKSSMISNPAVTVSVIKTKEFLEETLSSDVPPEPEKPQIAASNSPAPVLPPGQPAPPLVTPAQKKASITQFVEVENKLEEMFAGIVEEDPVVPKTDNVEAQSDSILGLTDDGFKLEDSAVSLKQESLEESPLSPKDVKDEEVKKESIKKKVQRSRPPSKRESDQDGEVPSKKKKLSKPQAKAVSVTPTKKLLGVTKSPKKPPAPVTSNRTPVKPANSDVAKDIYAYDSSSNASSSRSRGPFVQIRGPRDSPLSVSVVNSPLNGDEDGEKKVVKNKKFHDDSEYRHKVRSKGLHCSTLSNKYDAERKDTSWICAFCKRGPHASELTGPSLISEVPAPGDLFGPYFITTQCPEFEKRLDDPYDRHFKSRKIGKVLDAQTTAASKTMKKAKRKSESVDPGDSFLGITDTSNNTFEVWTHEDCMVWSPGVYLVGPKIAGLEEAVWTCSNIPCSGCNLRGANVTCGKRGCLSAAHLCCARKLSWRLDEDDFKAFCPLHSH